MITILYFIKFLPCSTFSRRFKTIYYNLLQPSPYLHTMQDVGVMLNMLGLEKHAAALRKGGFTTSGDVVDDLEGACALMSGGRKDKDTLRGYMSMRAGQPREEVELAERRAAAFSMVRGALDDLNRLQQRKAQLSSSVGKGKSSTLPGQRMPKDAEDLLDKLDDAKERLKAAQQELATLAEMGSAASSKRRPSTASSAATSRRRPSSASAGSTSPRVANEGRADRMPKMGATSFSSSHPQTPPPIKKGPIPEWGDAPYLDSFRANRPQCSELGPNYWLKPTIYS